MARSSERLKSSVGVVFTTSTQANPKYKIKVFKNKTVDKRKLLSPLPYIYPLDLATQSCNGPDNI